MNTILEKRFVPEDKDSAKNMGSGSLDVLSTPVAVAYLENASLSLMADSLEEGQTSVGIMINVNHVKASKIGQEVIARSELLGVDGRKYSFKVRLSDLDGNILAEGTHDRFVVFSERFMSKL